MNIVPTDRLSLQELLNRIETAYLDIDAVDVNLQCSLDKFNIDYLKSRGLRHVQNKKIKKDEGEPFKPWRSEVGFVGMTPALELASWCRSTRTKSSICYLEIGLELVIEPLLETKFNWDDSSLAIDYKNVPTIKNKLQNSFVQNHNTGEITEYKDSIYTKFNSKNPSEPTGRSQIVYVRDSKHTEECCIRVECRFNNRDAVRRAGLNDIFSLTALSNQQIINLFWYGKIKGGRNHHLGFYEIDAQKLNDLKSRNSNLSKCKRLHADMKVSRLKSYFSKLGKRWQYYVSQLDVSHLLEVTEVMGDVDSMLSMDATRNKFNQHSDNIEIVG